MAPESERSFFKQVTFLSPSLHTLSSLPLLAPSGLVGSLQHHLRACAPQVHLPRPEEHGAGEREMAVELPVHGTAPRA
jgi:hypothetical protein